MSLTQRLTIWIALITVMFGIACMWTYQEMQTQKRLAQVSANNQNKCLQIANAIDDIRQQAQNLQPADEMNSLVQQIQKAASDANMPMQHIQRIRPSSPRRLGQSPYIQKPTQLSLQNVTMKNAVTFLHHLATDQPDMQIQSLRITSPRSNRNPSTTSNAQETWKMEVGLASIAYAPQMKDKN